MDLRPKLTDLYQVGVECCICSVFDKSRYCLACSIPFITQKPNSKCLTFKLVFASISNLSVKYIERTQKALGRLQRRNKKIITKKNSAVQMKINKNKIKEIGWFETRSRHISYFKMVCCLPY